MKNFAISDLENLSGVKAHTLRIWEQRYDFIKPRRNEVNFRYYTIDEVGRLLNVALLTKNGHRISNVSSMNHQEVVYRVNRLDNDSDQQQRAINDLIVSMYTLNPNAFEATLDLSLNKWTSGEVLKKIILVFLQKTDLFWQGNRLPEEHFVVTIIRKKILAAINQLPDRNQNKKMVLLYLPDGKQLDLLLLYTQYLLQTQGVGVLYMGAGVSFSNIQAIVEVKQPTIIFTYYPKKNKIDYTEISNCLFQIAPQTKMLICTYPQQEIKNLFSNLFLSPYEEAIQLMTS